MNSVLHYWVKGGTVFGAKPLLYQYSLIVNWILRNKRQWSPNQNKKLFVHENVFENDVCEMAAIWFRGKWVEVLWCHLISKSWVTI